MVAVLLAAVLAVCPQAAEAERSRAASAQPSGTDAIDALIGRLSVRHLARALPPSNAEIDIRTHAPPRPVNEPEILRTLEAARPSPEQAMALWEFFADEDNWAVTTLPVIKALAAASDQPQSRQALWSELSALARAYARGDRARTRERSLLGLFERNRDVLLPQLVEVPETEGSSDEMIELMLSTRVFGSDQEESVRHVSGRIPAAVARHIERKRELGQPVRWEYPAFESMARWKDARLLARGVKAPRSLAGLDAAGETFIVVFNCLHTLDIGFREVMLRGLGPVEIFNAVVAGEKELYRLGTSGYRTYLHAVIMRGIKEAGSFEAFIDRAAPRHLGEEARRASGRRAMVFLRVVSSFGLIEPVLATVRDRDRFIDGALSSLGDPSTFEENSSVVLDVLTARSGAAEALGFRTALLERLYERYAQAGDPLSRGVYGSMLSVYQTVADDHRDPAIDTAYPLDRNAFLIPFERLFSDDGSGGYVHRMFMRLDETIDDTQTFANFRTLMLSLGASVRDEEFHIVFTIADPRRRIEIYANRPTSQGLRQGIDDIEDLLRGMRVETVIGRGHTNIIAPLQKDARRLLGERLKSVAVVFVGSCGGDASVRELIRTFGYIPFLTTKSTGRQVINNAIIKSYIADLATLQPGERLDITEVVRDGTQRFLQWSDEELRADARLYHVNRAAVLGALLFDSYLRPHIGAAQTVASE